MQTLNLVIGILYTLLFALLFVDGTISSNFKENPVLAEGLAFLAIPVLLNWLTFVRWNDPLSPVRVGNLIIAIVESVLLLIILGQSISHRDGGLLASCFIFTVPVLVNWLSYLRWRRPPNANAN